MSRLLFALGFALAGLLASSGVAAADVPDWSRDEVIAVTAVVAGGLMLFLLTVYTVKWYFGLTQPPPPPEAEDHAGHH